MAALRRLGSLTLAVALGVTSGCASPAPSTSTLEADNPLPVIGPAPFGMEDFFAEAPTPAPARVRLGRWLFYDRRLSADGTIACASCHRPEHAFSAPTAVSTGVAGRRGRRKAPSLVNLAARTLLVDTPDGERDHTFFWDGRATGLERQVLMPIDDLAEMALGRAAAASRVAAIPGYRPYFNDAFGSGTVTLERLAAALADYVRMRRSGNAAYDRWSYGGDGTALSVAARRGSDVFFFTGRCAVCHAGFNFSDGRFHNLGIGWNEATQRFDDAGRLAVSGRAIDRGRFKTPGLRDVSKHAPYMHDGSIGTLREVVEFYNRGGRDNPWRSLRLAPLGLSSRDIDDLVAFLEGLDGEGYADRAPRLFPQ